MINIDMTEKVVIVTGGAQGIGAAMVRDFAEAGAKVVIADILSDKAIALAKELTDNDKEVLFKRTDVSNTADIIQMVNYTIENFGGIDILCNNAAVNIPGDVLELSEETWDKTMNINVKSQFLISKHVIPHMQAKGGGNIINTASANSFVAEPQLAAYVTSKGAIKMLTQSMAIDHAKDGIRVNCICPGFVDTTFNDAHADLFGGREEVLKDIDKIHPIGRTIQPSEIAKIALFLASDLASCITGASIQADGGLTAGA